MILEEETYEKFGYYPSDLKPKSSKPIIVKCEDCGKIRESSKGAYRTFCRSCGRKGKRRHNWVERKKETICVFCGSTIPKRFLSKLSQHTKHFCNRDCMGKWQSNQRGKDHQCWKGEHGGKIKLKCPICGKRFWRYEREIKAWETNYCNPKCARKGRKKFPKHHTKPELIFEQICKKNNLPFKYTGDGSFWIGKNPSMNPDFVECNGKKIAIEIFSYWHDPLKRHCKVPYSQTYEGRKEILKKHKWKLVVFWQEDLEREDAEQFVLLTLKKYL